MDQNPGSATRIPRKCYGTLRRNLGGEPAIGGTLRLEPNASYMKKTVSINFNHNTTSWTDDWLALLRKYLELGTPLYT